MSGSGPLSLAGVVLIVAGVLAMGLHQTPQRTHTYIEPGNPTVLSGARGRVGDIAELKDAAVSAGLTWPDGHPFERTESKSAQIVEREKYLESSNR
jgi:hypothetical protein